MSDTVISSQWSHIGVHTGMYSAGLVDQVEKSVITKAKNQIHQVWIVGGFSVETLTVCGLLIIVSIPVCLQIPFRILLQLRMVLLSFT